MAHTPERDAGTGSVPDLPARGQSMLHARGNAAGDVGAPTWLRLIGGACAFAPVMVLAGAPHPSASG